LAIATPDNAAARPASGDDEVRDMIKPLLATDKFSVVSLTDFRLLDGILEKWQALAAQSVERNPFFEPERLRPALARFGAGADLRVVLIYAPNGARPTEPLLCGVFPLERHRHQ